MKIIKKKQHKTTHIHIMHISMVSSMGKIYETYSIHEGTTPLILRLNTQVALLKMYVSDFISDYI